MTVQIRLEFNNIDLSSAESLKHYFNAELFTKHQTARLYPNLTLEEVHAKIKALESKHTFTLSYISNDLKQYGFENYVDSVKLDPIRELDINDMYKLKGGFGMGDFFEGISDTDEMFMPALGAAFEEIAGQFGLSCELIEIKEYTARYKDSENEQELCVTYSPSFKTVLVQMGVQQAVSPSIDEGDGYQVMYDFIETDIINEEFFPDLI